MARDKLNIDFLAQAYEEKARVEAQNILDSYTHPWDLLAESTQNAVDAIRKNSEKKRSPKELQLSIDCKRRVIEVYDSGTGIEPDKLRYIFTPHVSFKRNDHTTIGEKGVGLSFLVLASNYAQIETQTSKGAWKAEIKKANDWINELIEDRPTLVIKQMKKSAIKHSYTRLILKDVASTTETDEDIFQYSKPMIIHMLRTKTAIGNTANIFHDLQTPHKLDIEVKFKYIDSSGREEEFESIPFSYAAPHTYLQSNSYITLSDLQEMLKQRHGKRASGKCIIHSYKRKTKGGRKLRCFVFVGSRKTYEKIGEEYEIALESFSEPQSGIFIATRGMPTGITVSPPKTGFAGYWFNMHILIEDDDQRFDIGRKSLRGRLVEMYRESAKELFNMLVPHISELSLETRAQRTKRERELAQLKEHATKTPNLNLKDIQYTKEPVSEQGVISIFHELVGAQKLEGYKTLRTHSLEIYDAIVNYRIDKNRIGVNESAHVKGKYIDDIIFLEFKQDAAALLDDIESRRKWYEELQLLVCWNISKAKLTKEGIEVEDKSPDDVYYFGTTHTLYFAPHYGLGASDSSLDVICLSDIIKYLRRK